MSQLTAHQPMVGNEFVLPRPRFSMTNILVSTDSDSLLSAVPLFEAPEVIPVSVKHEKREKKHETDDTQLTRSHTDAMPVLADALPLKTNHAAKFALRYVWTILALVLLAAGSAGVEIAAKVQSDRITDRAAASIAASEAAMVQATKGLDMMVPNSEVQSKLAAITAQSVVLSVGTNQVNVGAQTIRSWIQATPNPGKSVTYLHINTASMVNSLTNIAKGYVIAPVNQVSVTHDDGITPSGIILDGRNGTGLSDPSTIVAQAKQVARSVMNAAGLQFSTPLAPVPFQSVTPSAFNKLLEVNVSTKRMYAYQNGQLVQTFLVSAGKPSTPTPLGEFHIWDKTPDQTMTGPGYVQPNVHWINYFDHNGDAVHGNYWRPASVFGYVNTSHGCVGIPDNEAEWVYDWAPIGTTVINYST